MDQPEARGDHRSRAGQFGLYTSFAVDQGTLEVESPLFAGKASSDFFWNEVVPEFAFVPVPHDTVANIPGIAQFEIAITEAE